MQGPDNGVYPFPLDGTDHPPAAADEAGGRLEKSVNNLEVVAGYSPPGLGILNEQVGVLGEKGLGTISSVYTPYSYFKDMREKLGADENADMRYNAMDVNATGISWKEMQSDLDQFETRPGYDITMGLFPTIARAESQGMRIDRTEFDRLRNYHENEALYYQAKIEHKIGRHINVNSSVQILSLIHI